MDTYSQRTDILYSTKHCLPYEMVNAGVTRNISSGDLLPLHRVIDEY